jgi:hypothetical protein
MRRDVAGIAAAGEGENGERVVERRQGPFRNASEGETYYVPRICGAW